MRLNLARGNLSDQPKWWQNFIKDIDSRNRLYDFNSNHRVRGIIREIEDIGAVAILESDTTRLNVVAIEFDDDAKATWFILKWS